MENKFLRILSKEPICCVYSVTNKINGKIYIGQSIDVERRWSQHKYGKGNLILKNAIKKYGIDNFEFTILEKVDIDNKSKNDIIELLTIIEQKWFDLKKPYLKENGYNIQKTSKPNLTPNKDYNFGQKISKIKIDNNHTGKPLNQYNLNGDLIKEWKSAAEIERVLGFNAENISACCLGKSKTSNGFIWKFVGIKLTELEIINSKVKIRKKKKVAKYSLTGELIEVFDSLIDAAKNVGCPQYQISKVCTGVQKTCRNYKWVFI